MNDPDHDGGGLRPAETRVCRRCELRANLVRNPYYGSGLAVHEHLIICDHCGYTEFPPAPPHREQAPDEHPGWQERLRGLLRPDH